MDQITHKANHGVAKGIIWAFAASAMFGISTTILQYISNGIQIPPYWYLSTRTMIAGLILLIISACLYGKHIFVVFSNWRNVLSLVSYAVFGLGANLLTFYLSLHGGTSAMSAILQYLAPIFIIFGMIVFQHKKPLWSDLLVFVIAMVGVVLSLTKGNFAELSISLASLIFGIGSGLTQAFYIILPKPLVKQHVSPLIILGWGTFIAGLFFNGYHPLWVGVPQLTLPLIASLGCVILVGTILSFLIVLHASRFTSSEVISLVDATEPIVAFILSFVFTQMAIPGYHVYPNLVQIVGAILVILAISLLQIFHANAAKKRGQQGLE